MKTLLLLIFLTAPLFSQTSYMNINLGGSYKSADVDDITEISFSADGLTMTTTTATSGTSTDAISGITEITFDGSELGSGLPVELVSFNGTMNEGRVILTWETATEVNNYGFEIEQSVVSDQQLIWKRLGFIEGHGNSNSPKEYSYTVVATTGTTFQYRLKQIDIDGSHEYSETIVIELEAPVKYKLEQNYPNPFNPSTIISYQIPVTSNVDLRIYDMLGREVAILVNEQQEEGRYRVEFNGSNLSSGIYLYKLTCGEYESNKKLLLLR